MASGHIIYLSNTVCDITNKSTVYEKDVAKLNLPSLTVCRLQVGVFGDGDPEWQVAWSLFLYLDITGN